MFAPYPGQPLALTWVTMRLKFGGVVESFWPGSEVEMGRVSHLMVHSSASFSASGLVMCP